MSLEVGGLRIRGRPMDVSQMFLGIDVARFMPVEDFAGRMDRLVEMSTLRPAMADLLWMAVKGKCRATIKVRGERQSG